jgi:hypothetical protein
MILLAGAGGWFLVLNPSLRSDLMTKSGKLLANVFY